MSLSNQHLYEFGPFRLDTAKRLLLRQGEPVTLAPKAFDVLLVLVSHQGEVLEKDRLMEMLWPDSAVEEANLSLNISALRKALGESPGERKYITTIPGRGYKFAAEVSEVGGEDETVILDRHAKATVVAEESAKTLANLAATATVDAATAAQAFSPSRRFWRLIALSVVLLAAMGFYAYRWLASNAGKQIDSIAVLPFENASGNADVEYLSDGMTESLINSLSQLPQLAVKARSLVFRYKGKEVAPQQAASELSVQAILSGRVVQRGNELTLYLSLIDGRTGNQLWGDQYNRKMMDLVSLQREIALDVSQKLRVRLSGVEEQKLAKNYTENSEAYQLYFRGRHHLLKTTRSELQKGISYFQQAIDKDPAYALAYVGLADAYRTLGLAGNMPAMEIMPKAKAAAQKALEIDDSLAAAHAVLGFTIYWYDWDWSAAENQFKGALELDPNNADAHLFYAHFLVNTGRFAEGLGEAKRARELEPLNLRINALEGQFMIHAGQVDEALARLAKTLELNPTYWLTHSSAASAYIEKGRYEDAIAAARKAREFSGVSSQPTAFLGYALAKSGRRLEAQALIDELLKASIEDYASPYSIALIYNGLGEREKSLTWLERGLQIRDPRMTFLKAEPKWHNLRDDARFQDLLRRIGLAQ